MKSFMLLFRHLYTNEKLIVFILIILYLLLELWNIELPGLFADEALPACGSLQLIRNIDSFLPSIKICNIYFPMMLADYESAIESYILLPFLFLFGINVNSLRLAPIIVGVFSLIFLYFFVKHFFDKKTALISVVLLGTNPIFLLETKLGLNSASMLHVTAMGALLCLYKWYRAKNFLAFILGMLLLSLGLSIRVWFAWFIGGLLCSVIVFKKKIKKKMGRKIWVYILLGLFIFIFGNFLFVYYNLKTEFSTVHYIIDKFSLTQTNINNFQYLKNLLQRIQVFTYFISGRWSFEEQGSWFQRSWDHPHPLEKIPISHMLPWAFYISFIWLAMSLLFRRPCFAKKKIKFFLILILTILLLSPFTLSSLGGPHLFILYPFVVIIIAIAVVDFMKRNKITNFFISIVFLIIILINIKVVISWQYYFNQTGGIGNNSNAIHSLVAWLKEKNISELLVCDWGFTENIVFLSEGRIFPRNMYSLPGTFPYGSGNEDIVFIENCKKYFINEKNFYLFHTPVFTNLDRYNKFKEIAFEMDKTIFEQNTFYQKDGRPIYVIYSVR